MQKLMLVPLIFLAYLPSSHAANFDIPDGCEYGRDRSYDVSTQDLQTIVDSSILIFGSDGDPYVIDETQEEGSMNPVPWEEFIDALNKVLDSLDYLRIEAPSHVLANESFRAKGNLFDVLAYVKFYNSERGYVGKDKSNWEANSYLHMSFDNTYGYGLVWVQRGGFCSAEGVWVQKAPVLTPASVSGGSNIQVSFSYLVDQFSRAAKDPGTKAAVTIYADADSGGQGITKTINLNALSGSVNTTLTSSYRGLYHVYAILGDGTFSTQVDLGTAFINTGASNPPCPRCGYD